MRYRPGLEVLQERCVPAEIHSIASGNWFTPAIWSLDCVPQAGDAVTIEAGTVVQAIGTPQTPFAPAPVAGAVSQDTGVSYHALVANYNRSATIAGDIVARGTVDFEWVGISGLTLENTSVCKIVGCNCGEISLLGSASCLIQENDTTGITLDSASLGNTISGNFIQGGGYKGGPGNSITGNTSAGAAIGFSVVTTQDISARPFSHNVAYADTTGFYFAGQGSSGTTHYPDAAPTPYYGDVAWDVTTGVLLGPTADLNLTLFTLLGRGTGNGIAAGTGAAQWNPSFNGSDIENFGMGIVAPVYAGTEGAAFTRTYINGGCLDNAINICVQTLLVGSSPMTVSSTGTMFTGPPGRLDWELDDVTTPDRNPKIGESIIATNYQGPAGFVNYFQIFYSESVSPTGLPVQGRDSPFIGGGEISLLSITGTLPPGTLD